MLKILNLVIYSYNEIYEQMYKLTSSYYSEFSNVDTIYICYKNNKNNKNTEENKNILELDGEESIVPGVLDKTVKALLYFSYDIKEKYDYVIRSNISTVIEFKKLNKLLLNERIDYGGGLINTLNWLDPPSGIINKKYFGTKFVSGTCIIMSKNTVLSILSKQDLINYTIIDDVSIGILIKNYFPDISIKDLKNFVFVNNINNAILKVYKNYIFYRHKTKNRKNDIINMTHIINLIS